jgi:hypothetical protein
MEKRIDPLTAIHVDLAVAVSVAFGSATAVEAAHDLGIDPRVTQRVLLKGGVRRGFTSATPEPSSHDALRT